MTDLKVAIRNAWAKMKNAWADELLDYIKRTEQK
jgi:hypothetical protein